jgi:hypothetical protein
LPRYVGQHIGGDVLAPAKVALDRALIDAKISDGAFGV